MSDITGSSDRSTECFAKLHSILEGEVASLQPYGAFIRFAGQKQQGLVHKSQISISRVDDPSEVLSLRENVFCKVISIESGKIGLSMKHVNQTNGQDLDANNVQLSLDQQKKKGSFQRDIPKIELGTFLETTCRKCGGKGHFTQDCFHTEGGKAYDLIPDIDELAAQVAAEATPDPASSSTHSAKKAKKRKHKKEKGKKKKKRKHDSSSSDSNSSSTQRKKRKSHKKHHHRHHSRRSSSDDA